MATNKAFLKLATLAKGNTMKLNDRVVWSWLVYRRAKGRGSTKVGISKATSLHPHTVRQSIKRLEKGYLVERRDGRWYALKGEVFCYRGDGEWHQQLRYAKVLLPNKTCPLTMPQIVIYSLLRNGVRKRIRSLAKIGGVAENTVRSALRKLASVGLLDETGACPLSDEQASWFRDKAARVQAPQKEDWPTFHTAILHRYPGLLEFLERACPGTVTGIWLDMLKQFAVLAAAARYRCNECLEFLSASFTSLRFIAAIGKLLQRLTEFVKKAEQRTEANRKRGKYYGPSSFGMFRMMVDDFESAVKAKAAG